MALMNSTMMPLGTDAPAFSLPDAAGDGHILIALKATHSPNHGHQRHHDHDEDHHDHSQGRCWVDRLLLFLAIGAIVWLVGGAAIWLTKRVG